MARGEDTGNHPARQAGRVQQLPLFMTPREIVAQYQPNPGDYEGDKSASDLWSRKANEAATDFFHKTRGPDGTDMQLSEAVARQGVRYPISLSPDQGIVVGGHHRIATALESRPDDPIPVLHFKDLEQAQDSLSGGAGYLYT